MFDWETATYGKIYDDIDLFKDFEADFPAIVYSYALASDLKVSSDPLVINVNVDTYSQAFDKTIETNHDTPVNIEHMLKVSEKACILEHRQRVQESPLILTTYTSYHSRSICRIQDFDELKNHCLTLKNTPYPHQRYAVYNTLVNEEEPTGFTSIRRIQQEDTVYPCPNFKKTSMTRRLNMPYPEAFIRRIERRLMNILESYNREAYAKYPNTPYTTSANTAYRPFSRLYKYKTLNLVL
ncbi:hypothetical protein Tco_0948763, partial [Tanacetum coccineum]